MVSHKIDAIVSICDRVAYLRNGKLIACGDSEEVSEQYGIPKGSRVNTMVTYNDTLWFSVYGKGIAKYANNKTCFLDKVQSNH